ncbi:MAG TPA: ornithine carbamoyltransferase [Actinomycetota bacterium]|nr:ornithine carbamoyltransferase [Actinomycetota bacterium]
MKRDFLGIGGLSPSDLGALLDRATQMKAARASSDALRGRSIAMIFEKPSTRTRISFEVAIAELGGTPVVLNASELQLGRGETIEDTARVLSRYVHAVVVRTFEQERLDQLAAAGSIPVVNALSDHEHPCQALADLLTVRERFGTLQGRTLAYIGDGNNVAHSLMLAGALAGMRIAVATPEGYEPVDAVIEQARGLASEHGGEIVVTNDPAEAAAGAHALYTDVWASMGQEDEADTRRAIFAPYQLNWVLVGRAASDSIVMHCLPAHRGEEITEDVIDGPQSVVWDQAENRLHTQKAVLEWLLP